ncbi:MAG: hybrid sensor histidine kinase/response regulator [SAR324 cluster bacterium]|nr:hybrid sensor histidine kinase/response regulator [SAR324 cluster bacterium]
MSSSGNNEHLAQQYIQECLGYQDRLKTLIQQLGSVPSSKRGDILESIRDIIYAIQGGAGFFKMPAVIRLCGGFQQILQTIQISKDPPTEMHTGLLEQSRNMLEKIFNKGEKELTQEINEVLANFARQDFNPDLSHASMGQQISASANQNVEELIDKALKLLNQIKDANVLNPPEQGLEPTAHEAFAQLIRILNIKSDLWNMPDLRIMGDALQNLIHGIEHKTIEFHPSIRHLLIDSKYRVMTLLQTSDPAKYLQDIKELTGKMDALVPKAPQPSKSVRIPEKHVEIQPEKSKPSKTTSAPTKKIEVAEIVKEFITEAFEHISILEERLLYVENMGGEPPQAIIDELFRSVHSIKGGAGFFGMVKVTRVSDIMENILDRLRTGSQPCTPDITSKLLSGVDLLRVLLEHVEHDEAIDVTPYLEGQNMPALPTAVVESGEPSTPHPQEVKPTASRAPVRDETNVPAASTAGNSIRVSTTLLNRLMGLAGELVLIRNQQLQVIENMSLEKMKVITQRLNLVTSELQENITRTRMQSINNVFSKFPRIVRDLSRNLNKKIELQLEGQDVELDRTILESLSDPLTHLIRNAADHGIELPEERRRAKKPDVGKILLKASHEEGMVLLEISDDGKGMSLHKIKAKAVEKGLFTTAQLDVMSERDLLNLVFHPGFSTAERVTNVSGRGVGMDVVRRNIEQLGGFIHLRSRENIGTRIEISLPLTMAIMPTLITMNNNQRFAIPQTELVEVVCLHNEEVFEKIEVIQDTQFYRLRDELLPLIHLTHILNHQEPLKRFEHRKIVDDFRNQQTLYRTNQQLSQTYDMSMQDEKMIIVLRNGIHQFGLIVDSVLDTEEIVVKPLHSRLKNCRCFSGATIMGDGQVALILDIAGIIKHSGLQFHNLVREQKVLGEEEEIQNLLFFRTGETEQFAVALPLISRVEQVQIERIEYIGNRELLTINEVVYRVLRLDHLMNVSPVTPINNEAFLIVAKNAPRPCGILAQSLIDIAAVSADLNLEACLEPGTLGSFIFEERLSIFLDFYALMELMDAEWFQSRPVYQKHLEILLIEPSPMYHTVIKSYLRNDRHKVVGVNTLKEGLRILDAGARFHAIIVQLDNQMEHQTTREITQLLHDSLASQNSFLIAISEKAPPEQILQAGFNEVLTKLNRTGLKDCMNKILEHQIETV